MLAEAIKVLKTASPLMKILPPPLNGILEGLLQAATVICENADLVLTNKEEFGDLAREAAWLSFRLALAVADPAVRADSRIKSNLKHVQSVLHDIRGQVIKNADMNRAKSFLKQTFSASTESKGLARLRRRLDVAVRDVMVRGNRPHRACTHAFPTQLILQIHVQANVTAMGQSVEDVVARLEGLALKDVNTGARAREDLAELSAAIGRLEAGQQKALELMFCQTSERVEADARRVLKRLHESLMPAMNASHEGADGPPGCMRSTRVALLAEVMRWAEGKSMTSTKVYWLSGLAGTGKSTIARSAADELVAIGINVISLYISRNLNETRKAMHVIRAIAYQLCVVSFDAREIVSGALEDDPSLLQLNHGLVTKRILEPALRAAARNTDRRIVIVVDALDESEEVDVLCGTSVLGHIAALICATTGSAGPVKLFVTSRREEAIIHAFRASMKANGVNLTHEVKLHDVDRHIVVADIRTFLQGKFEDIRRSRELLNDWPSPEDFDELVTRSGALFVYASTVMRVLDATKLSPKTQLKKLLSMGSTNTDPSPFARLNTLYLSILDGFVGSDDKSPDSSVNTSVRRLLSSVILAREDVTVDTVASLSDMPPEDAMYIARGLSSIWPAPENANDPLAFFHQSFPDFLVDNQRCSDVRFYIDIAGAKQVLALRCLSILNEHPSKDALQALQPGPPFPVRNDIPQLDEQLAASFSSHFRYAGRHWLHHIIECGVDHWRDGPLQGEVQHFCNNEILNWVEVFALLDEFPSLNAVFEVVQHKKAEFVFDDRLVELARTAPEFQQLLQERPAEVHHSFVDLVDADALRRTYVQSNPFSLLLSSRNVGQSASHPSSAFSPLGGRAGNTGVKATQSFDLSLDGQIAVLAAGHYITVLSTTDEHHLFLEIPPQRYLHTRAWVTQNHVVVWAVGNDRQGWVHVWDLPGGINRRWFSLDPGTIRSERATLSPSGSLFAHWHYSGRVQRVFVWSIPGLRRVHTFDTCDDLHGELFFIHDEHSILRSRPVELHRLDGSSQTFERFCLFSIAAFTARFSMSAGGRHLMTFRDKSTCELWDLNTFQRLASFGQPKDWWSLEAGLWVLSGDQTTLWAYAKSWTSGVPLGVGPVTRFDLKSTPAVALNAISDLGPLGSNGRHASQTDKNVQPFQRSTTSLRENRLRPSLYTLRSDGWLNVMFELLEGDDAEGFHFRDANPPWVPRSLLHPLCWIPEARRCRLQTPDLQQDSILWSGTMVWVRSRTNEITALDFRNHPLFQQKLHSQ